MLGFLFELIAKKLIKAKKKGAITAQRGDG
jgi:hypothetical protein